MHINSTVYIYTHIVYRFQVDFLFEYAYNAYKIDHIDYISTKYINIIIKIKSYFIIILN